MFVAWQAERTRFVRRIFLAACLLPCAAVAGWAAWRHAPAHRDGLRRGLEAALGVGLSIGRVEHLRPGCVRLSDVAVRDDRGEIVLRLDAAEVEWSAGEARFRTAELDATPAAVAVAVRAARAWLDEPARHPRDVVVEVGRMAWAGEPATTSFGLRAECVAAPTGRAVRVRHEPETADGLVVRALVGTEGEPERLESRGVASRPVPVGVAAVLLDWPALAEVAGATATISGSVTTTTERGRTKGAFEGVLDGVDLAACTRLLPFRAAGRVGVRVDRCRVEDDRLVELSGGVVGGPGTVDRKALEALVTALGSRPGPAWPSSSASAPFDRLAAGFAIDSAGIRVTGAEGVGLIARDGRSVLDAPAYGVPIDRLAWALAPPGSKPVPATAVTGWLLSVLPLPEAVGSGQSPPAATRR